MQCMKCGLEIPDGQVFCDGCLEMMDKYPVKPDTPVHILPRKPLEKAQRKTPLSFKELFLREQRINRRLKALVLILAIAIVAVVALYHLWDLFPGFGFLPSTARPF